MEMARLRTRLPSGQIQFYLVKVEGLHYYPLQLKLNTSKHAASSLGSAALTGRCAALLAFSALDETIVPKVVTTRTRSGIENIILYSLHQSSR